MTITLCKSQCTVFSQAQWAYYLRRLKIKLNHNKSNQMLVFGEENGERSREPTNSVQSLSEQINYFVGNYLIDLLSFRFHKGCSVVVETRENGRYR